MQHSLMGDSLLDHNLQALAKLPLSGTIVGTIMHDYNMVEPLYLW